MDAMKRHIGHRIQVFLVRIPTSLKTGNGTVRAVELASLKGHHAGLAPRKGQTSDQQSSEHHPRLPAAEHDQKQEPGPLFQGVQVRPCQDHQATRTGTEHEAGHRGDEHVSARSNHVVDPDQDAITAQHQHHDQHQRERHRPRCRLSQGKQTCDGRQRPSKST